MNTTVPIIILNWNGIEDTVECISSVLQQSHSDFIIYLVDNGSNKHNVEILKDNYSGHSKINLIFNRENLGFTKGNNRELNKIIDQDKEYNYVALLNNDTVVEKDWLKNLVYHAEVSAADIVSSKMVYYYDRSLMDNAGHRMLNTAEILPIGHMEPIKHFCKQEENFGSCAGATLYSIQMLKEIGIFDEYFETGYEDAELGARATVLGYKCLYEPSAIVYHKVSRSIKKIVDYRFLLKTQVNIFYSYLKLMPTAVILINLPSIVFKYGMTMLISLILFRTKLFKVIANAFYIILFEERKKIFQKRKEFFNNHKLISSMSIMRKQEFFLWYDVKRFFKLVIQRKETAFENY